MPALDPAWGHGPPRSRLGRQGQGARGPPPIAHPSPSPPPQVESNFSSYHQFLMQALAYLDSPNRRLKLTAMKFIGRCGHHPIHVKLHSWALRSI